MKKLFRALAVLAILVLAGLTALSFWLRPRVEEQARLALGALSLSSAAGPLQTDAEQIEFSPFSRRLTLRGVSVSGVLPQGPVTYSIAEISLRLPLRMLLADTPLRDMVLPENGMLPVAGDVVLRNISTLTPQGKITIQREEINEIRAESSLVAESLEGKSIPGLFSLINRPFSLIYRLNIDEARAFFLSVDIPTVNRPVYMTVKEVLVRDWQGRSLGEVALADLQLRVDGKDVLRLGGLTEKEITLPEEALMRRLQAVGAAPVPDRNALRELLEQIVSADTPLFRHLRIQDLAFPLEDAEVELKTADFDWLSSKPQQYRFGFSEFTLPTAWVEQKTGLNLSGLPALVLAADFTVKEESPNATLEEGSVRAAGLGDLQYSLKALDNAANGQNLQQALLTQSYADLKLTYTDHNLTAYLARQINPNALLAVAVLKSGIAGFSSGASPENQAIAKALETFVQHPGTLEVKSLPGKRLRFFEVLNAFQRRDPAALLRVAATPGATALEEQIQALSKAR